MKDANSSVVGKEKKTHLLNLLQVKDQYQIKYPTMKVSLIPIGALIGLATAQNAIVNNHCSSTVYVQSFPYDGSDPGPLTTVAEGGTFSEEFHPSGSVSELDLICLRICLS